MIPDIPTYTDNNQGAALQKLAIGKVCLELGAWYGFTTVCMARHAKAVYSIDTHRGDVHMGKQNTLQSFITNLEKYNVLHKVAIFVGETEQALALQPLQFFDLIFIDATHTYEAVKRDIELCLPLLVSGGIISFHDYEEKSNPDFGVTKAVDEFIIAGKFTPIDQVGTLLICQLPV